MTYKIIHTPEFNDQILKLFNKKQRIMLYKKMKELKTFPEAVGKSLRYDLAGIHQFYFLNKYRVWYFINFEKNEVWMLSAMHKKDAEKRY